MAMTSDMSCQRGHMMKTVTLIIHRTPLVLKYLSQRFLNELTGFSFSEEEDEEEEEEKEMEEEKEAARLIQFVIHRGGYVFSLR